MGLSTAISFNVIPVRAASLPRELAGLFVIAIQVQVLVTVEVFYDRIVHEA